MRAACKKLDVSWKNDEMHEDASGVLSIIGSGKFTIHSFLWIIKIATTSYAMAPNVRLDFLPIYS